MSRFRWETTPSFSLISGTLWVTILCGLEQSSSQLPFPVPCGYLHSQGFLSCFSNWSVGFCATPTELLLRLYLLMEFCFLTGPVITWHALFVVICWPQGVLLQKSYDRAQSSFRREICPCESLMCTYLSGLLDWISFTKDRESKKELSFTLSSMQEKRLDAS